MPRPLWTCPSCGHQFVTANIWHSCTRYTLDHHFTGRDPKLRDLFDAWLAFVERNGPVTVIAQKTRISFQVRVRFAGAIIRKSYIECGFWLKRRVESPRFQRVEAFTKHDFGYYFRLTDKSQLDDELAGWVREAYEVGCQKSG
jgi:hypothetical protein